ncbi:hypothetical protein J6590_102515 [Homalodisca vitripennis]|nr:hypothetical protein J6590_102515 [Homalodisca vitripennis]
MPSLVQSPAIVAAAHTSGTAEEREGRPKREMKQHSVEQPLHDCTGRYARMCSDRCTRGQDPGSERSLFLVGQGKLTVRRDRCMRTKKTSSNVALPDNKPNHTIDYQRGMLGRGGSEIIDHIRLEECTVYREGINYLTSTKKRRG